MSPIAETVDIVPRQPIVEVCELWSKPWRRIEGLICLRATAAMSPTLPTAELAIDYGLFDADTVEPRDDLTGWFVRLLSTPTPDSVAEASGVGNATIWTGVIAGVGDAAGGCGDVTDANDAAVPTGRQTIIARGLEHLLDRCSVGGSYIKTSSDDDPVLCDAIMPFNLRHRRGHSVSGNRSSKKYTLGGRACYVFSDDGEMWRTADIVEYLLARFGPGRVRFGPDTTEPTWGNLQLTTPTYRPAATVRQCLNQLIDRRRGHAWRCYAASAADGGVVLSIASIFDETIATAAGALQPGVATVEPAADIAEIESLTVRRSLDHRYDKITVRGAPIVTCGSVSFRTDSIEAGWTADDEDAYCQATPNDRRSDAHRHVWRRYVVPAAQVEKIFETDGGKIAWGCPPCDASGGVSLGATVPLLRAGMSFLRQLPFQRGGDVRAGQQAPVGSTPEYVPPGVLIKGSYKGDDVYCSANRSFIAPGSGVQPPGFSVRMLDGQLGFALGVNPNHLLADGALGHKPTDEPAKSQILFNHTSIVATLAIAGPERLKVSSALTSGSAYDARRELVIDVPNAEFWWAAAGTVIGYSGATLAKLEKHTVQRNDVAKLRAVLAVAKTWYGRARKAVSIAYGDLVYEYSPGEIILRLTSETGDGVEVGTPISRISWDFESARTTVETDFVELDFVRTLLGPADAAGARGGWAGGRSGLAPDDRDLRANLPVDVGGMGGVGVANIQWAVVSGTIGEAARTITATPCRTMAGADVGASGIQVAIHLPAGMQSPMIDSGDVIGYLTDVNGEHVYVLWSRSIVGLPLTEGKKQHMPLTLTEDVAGGRQSGDWDYLKGVEMS